MREPFPRIDVVFVGNLCSVCNVKEIDEMLRMLIETGSTITHFSVSARSSSPNSQAAIQKSEQKK